MITAGALVITLLTGTTPLSATPQPTGPADNAVTLITGDRVTVAGKGYSVTPALDREVTFTRQMIGGHLYVIPSDARPLIAKGVLDKRLFDITQLIQWDYGDSATNEIPLILQSPQQELRGAAQTRRLASLGMSTMRLPKANAAQTWHDLTAGARTLTSGATKLWLDGRRSYSLDQSVKQIGAPEAWKQGYTGKGVTVAVLDSGYDPGHPDLKDVVTQSRNFSSEPDISDKIGHGTHVSSIVAGAGEKYKGVAPDAKIALGKLGSVPTDSAMLAGMEWAAVEVKAKVVNMSIGTVDTPELDPVEQAVNELSERTGALFVVAAGNGGGSPVSSPGSADAALTVGAVDRQSAMANFSSTGPREGDHAIKPDVTAPGVGIVAAQAGGDHVAMSGTSMATPHVVGAAAILAQRHPDWTGRQLKAALIGSAAPVADATLYEQGSGQVDLVRALAQPVIAEPGNVWAFVRYGKADEQVQTKTITYTNSGDTPLTLDLSTDGEVLKLSAERLEVPAGGQASVTLTIDGRDKKPGDYPGTLTAKSGDQVIRTLAGASVEPESYNLTVNAVGRQGTPADFLVDIYNPDNGTGYTLPSVEGRVAYRLPKGKWNLFADVMDSGGIATIVHDTVTLADGDQQVTLDARPGKQVRFSIDDPAAVQGNLYDINVADGSWWIASLRFMRNLDGLYVVPARRPGMQFTIRRLWNGGANVYDLVQRYRDGLPDDPTLAAKRADLAKVSATYRASGVAAKGVPRVGMRFRDDQEAIWLVSVRGEVDLPGTLTHYRTPGQVWDSALEVGSAWLVDQGRAVRQGDTRETWNAAVTGPSPAGLGARRTGDRLTVVAGGLFADAGAGRAGTDAAATGTVTVAAKGQILATADLVNCMVGDTNTCVLRTDLPAEAATYTISSSMRREVPHSTLSTTVETAWTVRSSHTEGERPLPLMTMRYAPAGLDGFNRAAPGSTTPLPMTLERVQGAAQPAIKQVRLEMSGDDGTTWRPVPVTRTSSGWTAMVPNPRTPGHVSLRVKAEDASGTGLTQTVIRAYTVG
ncbi:S8 family serine peptidase [Nonomuraea purpurea]|uniref:S8 family serine peptidase n=1 Tax=Nonomuraea purpurea TaxID=1849276 RepID=A0ABV8GQC5_9ACTN